MGAKGARRGGQPAKPLESAESSGETGCSTAPEKSRSSKRRRLTSIAFWDSLRRRYPMASQGELARQASGVLVANLLVAQGLVQGKMRPWELVVLVALEALFYSAVSWVQLRFVPPAARPEEEAQMGVAARLGTLAFGLFWLVAVYGLIFGFLLRDLAPLLAALRDPLTFVGHSAIRWPLAIACGGALVDAVADRQFWKRHGGLYVSTPGFTAIARWLTLILGGIPFFVPFAAGGWAVGQVAKGLERRYLTGSPGRLRSAALLVVPLLGMGLLMLVGWLMRAGELGWTIGYCSAKFASELLILAVPLLAERASREERAALA